jgi:hypothetical protein
VLPWSLSPPVSPQNFLSLIAEPRKLILAVPHLQREQRKTGRKKKEKHLQLPRIQKRERAAEAAVSII